MDLERGRKHISHNALKSHGHLHNEMKDTMLPGESAVRTNHFFFFHSIDGAVFTFIRFAYTGTDS